MLIVGTLEAKARSLSRKSKMLSILLRNEIVYIIHFDPQQFILNCPESDIDVLFVLLRSIRSVKLADDTTTWHATLPSSPARTIPSSIETTNGFEF